MGVLINVRSIEVSENNSVRVTLEVRESLGFLVGIPLSNSAGYIDMPKLVWARYSCLLLSFQLCHL